MRNPVRRVALLAALVALACVVAPTPAFAHAGLLDSDPAQGARLDAAPRELTFSFSENIQEPAYIVVTAAGKDVQQGSPRVEGGTVTQQVAADAGSGPWTMAYRVVSTDGHPVVGEIAFTVADVEPAPEGTPAPTTGPASSPEPQDVVEGQQSSQPGQVGTPREAGLWARHGEHVIVGAVLLALAAGVLLVRRRSA